MNTVQTKQNDILSNYDKKIYHKNDFRATGGFCLRFNSGSFHYVDREMLLLAFEEGFVIGYHKREYTPMPWGMQHFSYSFEVLKNGVEVFKSELGIN